MFEKHFSDHWFNFQHLVLVARYEQPIQDPLSRRFIFPGCNLVTVTGDRIVTLSKYQVGGGPETRHQLQTFVLLCPGLASHHNSRLIKTEHTAS